MDGDLMLEETELRRGDILDELTTDEGTVVMVGLGPTFHVLRLSVLGAEILRLVSPGTTLGRLAVALRETFGEPPSGDLAELVRAAVTELEQQRVVVAGQGHERDMNDISAP